MDTKRRPYFAPEDFAAFAVSLAESSSPAVVRERKRVVEERMKPLHKGFGTEQGLEDFMRQNGLAAHWSPGHLTNVFWPYFEANAGWVDYIRMGYGKPEVLVKELARRSGVDQVLTTRGSYDAMAFHHVTQIQVGLGEKSWWIDWYQDRKAWLEQSNWLVKIGDGRQRRIMLDLLTDLQKASHVLSIFRQDLQSSDPYPDAEEFIEAAAKYRREGTDVSLIVGLDLQPGDLRNDEKTMPSFVRQEFQRLLPLYHFTAWHPKLNNYIEGLSV